MILINNLCMLGDLVLHVFLWLLILMFSLYSSMLLTGRLDQHLAEIDRSCEEQLEHIIQQMTKQEGVTEVLKATDQMAWVARMNSIRNRAEEIVLSEIVYR